MFTRSNADKAAQQRRMYHEHKNNIYDLLGNECAVCGNSDRRVLQIDHVNGGGHQDRANRQGVSYLRRILVSVRLGEGKYQLLCANCNWIKRHEEQEWATALV